MTQVTRAGGTTGSALLLVRAASAPWGGRLDVSPSSGVQLATER